MSNSVIAPDDPRLSWPILTRTQVAALTEVPPGTIKGWSQGSSSILHTLPNRRGWPTFPFIGLVEAEVARSLLNFYSPQKVKALLKALRRQHGENFTLADPHLVTDLSNTYLREGADLTRVPDSQGAFLGVIEKELKTLRVGLDGKIEAFIPTRLEIASVDPRFNGGSLSITRNRVPIASVVGSLRAGETSGVVASDYGLTDEEVARIETDIDWVQLAA